MMIHVIFQWEPGEVMSGAAQARVFHGSGGSFFGVRSHRI